MVYQNISIFKNLPKTVKMSEVIKQTNDLGLDNNTAENNTLFISSHLLVKKYNTDILLYYSFIQCDEMLQNTLDVEEIECNYIENTTYKYSTLFSELETIVSRNKIGFIYLDFDSYSVETMNHKNEVVSHATALIVYRDKNNEYRAFHFNPHGNASNENKYEVYITRTRTKEVVLNRCVDQHMIGCIFSKYNTHTKDTGRNCFIMYETTQYYNYMGANLQVGDSYGICYIYPFILLHELCSNLYQRNVLYDSTFKTYRRFPSYKHMLLHNDLYTMIYTIMSKISPKLKNIYFDYWQRNTNDNVGQECNSLMENKIAHYNTHFIKELLYTYVAYLSQPFYVTQISNYTS
tara:strand:- start:626 stop:1669 length:1044 start_codon:yes stop_codon:yes gene_type:complete